MHQGRVLFPGKNRYRKSLLINQAFATVLSLLSSCLLSSVSADCPAVQHWSTNFSCRCNPTMRQTSDSLKWLGVFQESHLDENSVAFLIDAGYPPAVAEAVGSSLSVSLFARDGDEFVFTISSPAAARVNTMRFKLGEKREMVRKHGVTMTSLFEWHEDTRTLSSYFWPSVGTGSPFELHLTYDETYQTIQRSRKTDTIESNQRLHRLA